jgi:hypothetical protein
MKEWSVERLRSVCSKRNDNCGEIMNTAETVTVAAARTVQATEAAAAVTTPTTTTVTIPTTAAAPIQGSSGTQKTAGILKLFSFFLAFHRLTTISIILLTPPTLVIKL